MNDRIPLAPLQKLAWFQLIVFATAVALYLMAIPFLAWHRHLTSAAAADPALGMFGVLGLWGFGVYFNYDRKRSAMMKLDEREDLINQRAGTLGMQIFWLVWVFSNMGVWAVFNVRHQTTVPVDVLPLLVLVGWMVFTVTQSIAILVQYKRSATNDAL